ncbi:HAMP domain-containing histidine kinase [Candidatus Wolfebacteria bacterium]|nr:HAMP domain-containing histidine kinase [Candidatus Wolfebacteria bacterium]
MLAEKSLKKINLNYSPTKFYSWYYPTVIGFVFVVGVLSTAYTYVKVTSSVKESLLKHASAIAYALEPRHIAILTGAETDLTNPDYIALKERFKKIRESSGDIRFAYLTGYRDGNSFFFVDSEPEDSPDYSPPGQVYYEAGPGFRDPFINNDKTPATEEIYSDRWGTWLTAITPIIDPENNQVIALMGIDMDAGLYYQMVFAYSALPAAAASFFIFLFAVGYIIRKREQKFIEFKSELVSIASHEIRTPLTGISWVIAGLLRDSGNLSPSQKSDIELVKNYSRNLLLTVNDLLDLSAVEKIGTKKLNKQKIVMFPFFEKIAKNFHLALKEKSLKLIFDPFFIPDIAVSGDEDCLKRMFNNLISNAIKYSKSGGEITIGCMPRERSIVFWVKDQGIGVPINDKERIFEGFYRAENAKQIKESGTGLGLRYVRQIAELHGGKVWCESEENIGSTFFVELSSL